MGCCTSEPTQPQKVEDIEQDEDTKEDVNNAKLQAGLTDGKIDDMMAIQSGQNNTEQIKKETDRLVLKEWLMSIDLEEHYNKFIENGYENMDHVKTIENISDLKNIKIYSREHQRVLLKEIDTLNDNAHDDMYHENQREIETENETKQQTLNEPQHDDEKFVKDMIMDDIANEMKTPYFNGEMEGEKEVKTMEMYANPHDDFVIRSDSESHRSNSDDQVTAGQFPSTTTGGGTTKSGDTGDV